MPSVLRAEESTPVDTLKGKDGNLYIISKGANGEVTGIQVARKDAKGALMKKGDLIPYLKDAAQQPGGKTASRVFDVVEVMPSFPGGDVAMMDFVMKWARDMGCYTVTLNVWEGNDRAMAFYRSLGFEPRKTIMEKIV